MLKLLLHTKVTVTIEYSLLMQSKKSYILYIPTHVHANVTLM